jgi:hypothetical protein
MNLEDKMLGTCQLTAVNQGLKNIYDGTKTALHSKLRTLFEPLRSLIRAWSKNKVCCTPLKLQLLLKVKLHH